MRRLSLSALILALGAAISLRAGGALQSSTSAPTLVPQRAAVQHIVVEATVSAPAVARGGSLALFADVTPKPAIHVYAAGAPDVTPISLAVTTRAGIRVLPVKYPPAEKVSSLGALVPVPAYKKPFRIVQPVDVSSALAPGETVVVTGVLTYQACDDRLCYPTAAVPVRWTFTAR